MRMICLAIFGVVLLSGCGSPEYDLSTPEAAINSAQQMVKNGDADRLVELIHLPPRDISFEDGVTEASAIEDVKGKLSQLLLRMWTIGSLLNEQFPGEVLEEADLVSAMSSDDPQLLGMLGSVLASPFAFIDEHRDRIETMDLGDGTAAILYDGEPGFGGLLAMEELEGKWKVVIPTQFVQDSEYWPQTRWEWAVIASMMLSIENGLEDFENEVRAGEFRSLEHASERAGRFIGESVIVQGIIYASMKRDEDDT